MNDTKSMTIDSYNAWLQELKEMVEAAEKAGISREWSEDYIIALLPAVFRRWPHGRRLH